MSQIMKSDREVRAELLKYVGNTQHMMVLVIELLLDIRGLLKDRGK